MIGIGIVMFVVLPAVAGGVVLWWVVQEFRPDRVPILLYHRIISRQAVREGRVPDAEPIWACYDDVFAEQMEHLKTSGYETLDLDDYAAVREGRRPRPRKPVVITFDDGYSSNYEHAFPVLRRNGQKATIFVALEPDEHTRRQVSGIDGFLSPEQIREMAAAGVSIQSHTLTHCVLSELDDEAALYELRESRARLGAILGRPVAHVAVPRAGYSRRIRRLVQAAGYRTACCNRKGSANDGSDLLALPRIVIERDMTVADFARSLTPASAAVLRIVGNIKRIPERLLGARRAAALRQALYNGPLGGLFVTRRLKVALLVVALAYAAMDVVFVWHLIVRSRGGG